MLAPRSVATGQGGGDLETGHAGELDVHHDQRRLMDLGLMQGVVAVRGFGHHLQSGVLLQDAAETATEQRVIVDDHDPASEHCGGLLRPQYESTAEHDVAA